jgi:hypothetical protein
MFPDFNSLFGNLWLLWLPHTCGQRVKISHRFLVLRLIFIFWLIIATIAI